MSTHAFALSITGFAYLYARRRAADSRFTFGPWKVESLGGYTSAILLVLVALLMMWQAIQRIYHPAGIQYLQALAVASAIILRGTEEGADGVGPPRRKHEDLNLKAAYLHVVADATTSILAIIALVMANVFGLAVLDPVMGIIGGVIICVWGYGLLRDTSRVLLDREMDHGLVTEIRDTLESDGSTKVVDLHVWRIAGTRYACAVSVVTTTKRTPQDYRRLLGHRDAIAHATIEVTHRRTER